MARAQTAKLRVRKAADALPDPADPAKKVQRVRLRAVPPEAHAGGGAVEQKELVVYMDRCYVDSLKGDAAAELHGQEYATPLPNTIFGKPTPDRPSSQTWNELFVNLAEAKKDYADLQAELQEVRGLAEPVPAVGTKTNAELSQEIRTGPIRYTRELILKTEVEIQMRPALAVGCLCFVLIGCPVGIWASRSDYLSVFMICFLPTMFLYYPLLLGGAEPGEERQGAGLDGLGGGRGWHARSLRPHSAADEAVGDRCR